jgi:hypothetical protein
VRFVGRGIAVDEEDDAGLLVDSDDVHGASDLGRRESEKKLRSYPGSYIRSSAYPVFLAVGVIALVVPRGHLSVRAQFDGRAVGVHDGVANVWPTSSRAPRIHLEGIEEALHVMAVGREVALGSSSWIGTVLTLVYEFRVCLACSSYMEVTHHPCSPMS